MASMNIEKGDKIIYESDQGTETSGDEEMQFQPETILSVRQFSKSQMFGYAQQHCELAQKKISVQADKTKEYTSKVQRRDETIAQLKKRKKSAGNVGKTKTSQGNGSEPKPGTSSI